MESDGSAAVVEPRSEESAEPQQTVSQGALAILQQLHQALQGGNREQQLSAWSALADPDTMTTLAEGYTEDPHALRAIFSVLESTPRQTQRTRGLARAVANLATDIRSRRSQAVLDDIESSLASERTLAVCLDGVHPPVSLVSTAILEELRVPAGYDMDGSGVYRVTVSSDGDIERQPIARAPIFIVARSADVISGESRRQLVWLGPTGWCDRVVERRTIMDARQMLDLANLDAPVNSMTCGSIVTFLTQYEAENLHRFMHVYSTSTMGWQPNGGFMLPDKYISLDTGSDSKHMLNPPPGLETLSTGWTSSGSWDKWVEAVSIASSFPYVYIAIYASVAAPLLHILKVPGFVLDFSGASSGGKTSMLRYAASVWGSPSEAYPTAMFSWDATKVWIEQTSGFLKNLPMILDETKRAKYPTLVRDVIYDFCQGQGRGRGAKAGGTRHAATWQSILISSGEGAATDFSNDEGTRARVMSLKGRPFGYDPEIGARVSDESRALLQANYGHLGPKIAEYLVANTSNFDQFRSVFEQSRQAYEAASTNAIGKRHATYIAALELAAMIAHNAGLPNPTCQPFGVLASLQSLIGDEADMALHALNDVYTVCASNQTKFWGRAEYDTQGRMRVPYGGWMGTWGSGDDWEYIAIQSVQFRSILRDMEQNDKEILRKFDERGWLASSPGRKTKTITVDGVKVRCVCIARKAINEMIVAAHTGIVDPG